MRFRKNPLTSIRRTSITPGPDSFKASLIKVAASASPSAVIIAAYTSSSQITQIQSSLVRHERQRTWPFQHVAKQLAFVQWRC